MRATLLATVVALTTGPASAQYSTSIGATTSGHLGASKRPHWSFYGRAGDALQIDVASATFDTIVELYGPDGSLLGRDDDGGGGTHSRLRSVRLTRAGTHSVVVSPYLASATGDYTLTVVRTADVLDARATGYGQTVTDYIAGGERHAWTFWGQAGDRVTVDLTGAFDTFLELLGPDDHVLTTDDDGGEGIESRITGFRLARSGEHTVIARGLTDIAVGTYRLQVMRGGDSSGGDCTGSGTLFGNVRVGTHLRLGRHREVAGDANWDAGMDVYLGREAVVTALDGVDEAGCAVVLVDVDDGTYLWRVRDATVLGRGR